MSTKMYRAVCGNCGRIEWFTGVEEAFRAGWDTPDRFGYTACDRCPGVSVFFPLLSFQEARQATTREEREKKLQLAYKATADWDPAGGAGWRGWEAYRMAYEGGEE